MNDNIRASTELRLDIEERARKKVMEEDDARRDRVLYLRRLLDPDYTFELAGWAEERPQSMPGRRGRKRQGVEVEK